MARTVTGFWKALPQVSPTTRQGPCWIHKTANILDKMPKNLQERAKSIIHDICRAETKQSARRACHTPPNLIGSGSPSDAALAYRTIREQDKQTDKSRSSSHGDLLKNERVTPQEAEQVFFNRPLIVADDPKHSQKERIRVISARDMSRKERRVYQS